MCQQGLYRLSLISELCHTRVSEVHPCSLNKVCLISFQAAKSYFQKGLFKCSVFCACLLNQNQNVFHGTILSLKRVVIYGLYSLRICLHIYVHLMAFTHNCQDISGSNLEVILPYVNKFYVARFYSPQEIIKFSFVPI